MAISQRFAQGLLTTFRPYAQRWDYRIEAVYGLLGLLWASLRARRWLLFLSWGGVYFVAYTLLGVSRYYWYYAPFVPLIVVLAGLGITGLVSLLEAAFPLAFRPSTINAILHFADYSTPTGPVSGSKSYSGADISAENLQRRGQMVGRQPATRSQCGHPGSGDHRLLFPSLNGGFRRSHSAGRSQAAPGKYNLR